MGPVWSFWDFWILPQLAHPSTAGTSFHSWHITSWAENEGQRRDSLPPHRASAARGPAQKHAQRRAPGCSERHALMQHRTHEPLLIRCSSEEKAETCSKTCWFRFPSYPRPTIPQCLTRLTISALDLHSLQVSALGKQQTRKPTNQNDRPSFQGVRLPLMDSTGLFLPAYESNSSHPDPSPVHAPVSVRGGAWERCASPMRRSSSAWRRERRRTWTSWRRVEDMELTVHPCDPDGFFLVGFVEGMGPESWVCS